MGHYQFCGSKDKGDSVVSVTKLTAESIIYKKRNIYEMLQIAGK